MRILYILLILSLLTTSCASIFNGTKETLHLRSDVPGTRFYLDNEELGQDSVSYVVPKKGLRKRILYAKKENCKIASEKIETSFDPVTLFGLLVDFGLISILVVDWGINGVIYEADRTTYVLNPICEAPMVEPARAPVAE